MKKRSIDSCSLSWPLICLLAFILLAVLVQAHLTNGFDQLFLHIDNHQPHFMKQTAQAIGSVASPKHVLYAALVLFAIAVMICAVRGTLARWMRDIIFFIGNIVLAFAANEILKPLFDRIRPSGKLGSFSFPSDHAMLAFAFFVSLAIVFCKYLRTKTAQWLIWILAVTCTLGIGLSRVYLQKHYMTDILGAYLFDGFLLGILYWITRCNGSVQNPDPL